LLLLLLLLGLLLGELPNCHQVQMHCPNQCCHHPVSLQAFLWQCWHLIQVAKAVLHQQPLGSCVAVRVLMMLALPHCLQLPNWLAANITR
jgi:hypothetical protein